MSGNSADWRICPHQRKRRDTNVLVSCIPKIPPVPITTKAPRASALGPTSPQTIIDFSLSTTTVASGAPITSPGRAWMPAGKCAFGSAADSFASSHPHLPASALPCGRPASLKTWRFPVPHRVIRQTHHAAPVSVAGPRAFPEMEGALYDATHSLSAGLQRTRQRPAGESRASQFASSLNAPCAE